jgi:hypothetical protein
MRFGQKRIETVPADAPIHPRVDQRIVNVYVAFGEDLQSNHGDSTG